VLIADKGRAINMGDSDDKSMPSLDPLEGMGQRAKQAIDEGLEREKQRLLKEEEEQDQT
jgi:hypothetical protein